MLVASITPVPSQLGSTTLHLSKVLPSALRGIQGNSGSMQELWICPPSLSALLSCNLGDDAGNYIGNFLWPFPLPPCELPEASGDKGQAQTTPALTHP